jgi:hypothetical protein
MQMTKKEIIPKLEQLTNGVQLKFKLHQTFGGGYAIAGLNPKFPDKGEKKYLLRWDDNLEMTGITKLSFTSDKAKAVASWVADRLGESVP